MLESERGSFVDLLQTLSFTTDTHTLNTHYNDVIMSAIASQISGVSIVYSTVGTDRPISKKTSMFRAIGMCAGNSPVIGEFPAQNASNADKDSIWWHQSCNSLSETPVCYSRIFRCHWPLGPRIPPSLGWKQVSVCYIIKHTWPFVWDENDYFCNKIILYNYIPQSSDCRL